MSDPALASPVDAAFCQSCGRYYIPLRKLCPNCRGASQKTAVEGKGRLLSWTVVHVTPEGFPSPRTVALVGLECGASVLCLVTDNRKLEIGADARIAFADGLYVLR
jgi:uncharacterized OB-fold protein